MEDIGTVYDQIGSAFNAGIADIVTGVVGMVALILPTMMAIVGISVALGWGKKLITRFSK